MIALQVASLALSTRIHLAVGVPTYARELAAAEAMVAVVAHISGVVFAVDVRTQSVEFTT